MPKPNEVRDPVDPTDHNLRVADAIKAYCRFPHPQQFAVMIDGPWGSGKTHLVKSLMDDLAEENPTRPLQKPLYVSLYGVKDVGEINDQLFQQIHPILGHKYTRLGGRILRGALKATLKYDVIGDHQGDTSISGQIPELKMSEVMGDASWRVLIFDDFERAVMTPIEVLGYINPLVEHDGCKVLILANEMEVDTRDLDYSRRREKTVGRTLKMKANARAAFPSFLDQMGDPGAKRYLESIDQDVLDVFKDSGLDNLRLLNQFVWDFERFWLALTEPQRTNKQAMRELVTLLCAASLELRSGRIAPASFRRADINHFMRTQSKDPEPETVAADEVFKRYGTVNFKGTLLAPETMREIILDAAFPVQSVRDQLQGHPLFQQPKELPSWRALWYSFDLDVAELESTLSRFQQDFDNRTFHEVGEILHVVGLCLWMSDIGQPGWGAEDVVERLEAYVDDVYALRRGETDMDRLSSLDRLGGGRFGLGFLKREDSRFEKIASRIAEAAETHRRSAYPEIARRLQGMMEHDAEAFLREVCFTEAGPSNYARLGVLAHIIPRDFAAVIAGAKRGDQEKIAMALSLRYDRAQGEPELLEELPWLTEMTKELKARAIHMAPIPRHHLNGLISQYVLTHVPPDRSDGPTIS